MKTLKIKLLTGLLAFFMVFGLMPINALAAESQSSPLLVNGIDIKEAEDNTIVCGGGTAVYDSESNTLTLNNATIDCKEQVAIKYLNASLTIELQGNNTITSADRAIYMSSSPTSTQTLRFKGEGSLAINADGDAIQGDYLNIEIDGCDLNISAPNFSAINSYGMLTIQNGAEVTADSSTLAIVGENGVTIKDSTVNATVSSDETNAVYSELGKVTIDNSIVKAEATVENAYPTIWGKEIEILNNSNVIASSLDSNALYSPESITISGSILEARSTVASIRAGAALTVSNNAELIADGGIEASDGLTVTPASGKLVEYKAGMHEDGESGAVHRGNSPYDTAFTFAGDNINLDYTYIHIKEHTHTGELQWTRDENKHSAVYICCGRVAVLEGEHTWQDGMCTVCQMKNPNYVPPEPPIVITYYDITAEQPEHGKIQLSTDRIYRYGDVDVTLTPEEGYEVKDLLINGVSVGAVSNYTIEDVTGDIHVTALFGETEAAKNARIAKGVENTTIRMYYKQGEIGRGWIKLHYRKSFGFKVDNYEIFRSVKKNTSFGEKPFFVTKKNKVSGFYKNTKNVKKGVRHYYKMRGVREIAGETYYTQWSNLVMRTGR